MDFLQQISLIVFLISYFLIIFEHNFRVNKSGIAIFIGSFLWIITSFYKDLNIKFDHSLEVVGSELFDITIFLLVAMVLVEILIHYNFFDLIQIKLLSLKLDDRKQFLIIGATTFFLSALFDNLTITIIMLELTRRFFKKENLLTVASGVVIAANAGGAWSPLGDITTIMLWLAKKFSTTEIITQGFLPSLALAVVAMYILSRQIKRNYQDIETRKKINLTRGEKLVIFTSLISFTFPLAVNFFGLKPYLGLILGLGIVWILIEVAQIRSRRITHLEADIEKIIKKVDFSSILFIIGILLAVSALNTIGILEKISQVFFESNQNFNRVAIGNIILGIFSAIFDNIPLTAMAIDMIKLNDTNLWVLLALAVGNGGSLTIIGSAAGVVAMGIIKGLNFLKYIKIAFFPALIGYFVSIGVWFLQYFFLKFF